MVGNYRAVNGRVAVDLGALALTVDDARAWSILSEAGFKRENVDVCALARSLVGVSKYCRNADPDEAPDVVDCSSFIKRLFALLGVWLPRLPIQQRDAGRRIVNEDMLPSDLVFCIGRTRNYFYTDPDDQLGHVGLYIGNGKVVHAINSGVSVTSLRFFHKRGFRGVTRIVEPGTMVFTVPPNIRIETSDDLRYVILSRLPRVVREGA